MKTYVITDSEGNYVDDWYDFVEDICNARLFSSENEAYKFKNKACEVMEKQDDELFVDELVFCKNNMIEENIEKIRQDERKKVRKQLVKILIEENFDEEEWADILDQIEKGENNE